MIITKIEKPKIVMNPKYQKILEIMQSMSPNSIGVEVGVWNADLSCCILDNKPEVSKLYLVDPWKKYPSEEYIDSINNCSQTHFDMVYENVKNRIKPYKERAEVLRGTSTEFLDKFENNSLNFVYIDANHMYEFVTSDINNWYPKLKPGGLLIGNDFIEDGYYSWIKDNYGNATCFGEYGVKSAVRVFCKQKNLTYHTPGQNQWYIIK